MIEYLIKNENSVEMKDKKVLDLGCGAGILGIYAFLQGANVTFQDYVSDTCSLIRFVKSLI